MELNQVYEFIDKHPSESPAYGVLLYKVEKLKKYLIYWHYTNKEREDQLNIWHEVDAEGMLILSKNEDVIKYFQSIGIVKKINTNTSEKQRLDLIAMNV